MAEHTSHTLYWGGGRGSPQVPRPPASPLVAELDEAVQTLASLAARPQFHAIALEGAGLQRGVLPRHPAWMVDPALYGVLLRLSSHPGIHPTEMANTLGLHWTTICHHLARLEERGLLSRREDLLDRRSRRSLFTQPGLLAFETVRDARHAILSRLLERQRGEPEVVVRSLAEVAREVRVMHAAWAGR